MTKLFRALKVAFAGFVIALIGAVVGFGGFHVGERWLSIAGFAITIFGVAIGFIGIVYGWIMHGKQAITGSAQATTELRDKITGLWKSNPKVDHK